MRRLPPFALALLLIQSGRLDAQGPSKVPAAAQVQPPVFGATTGLVLVDFVVTGKGDRTVAGLSAADFVVKEDGKERPIVSFRAFDNPVAQAGPDDVVVEANPGAAEDVEPKRPVPLAVAVVIVDDGQLSLQQTTRLRPALKSLIRTLAGRNGALVLIAPWSKVSLAREAAGNIALFGAAVDKINGRRVDDRSSFQMSDAEAFAIDRGDSSMTSRLTLRYVALNPGFDADTALPLVLGQATVVAREARNRREDLYGVIFKSLDWLVKQPGRHTVIMVSGGFAHDLDDARQQELVTRSLRANAPIHFLDARGLQGMGIFQGVEYGPGLDRDAGETPFAWSEAAEGSSSLALDTGGIVVRNTNDMSKGLDLLMDTMTTYYVIGYEPPPHTKSGFRKIKVEARPKGLKVIARKGYFDEVTTSR